METKICSKCKIEKPIDDFRYKKSGKFNKAGSCIKCECKNSLEYYHKTKTTKLGKARIYRGKKRAQYRLKLEILNAYGNKCQCCGESNPFFLTIDHINNDGNIERKTGKYSIGAFYWWLKENDYPKENYQILCWNCNRGKTYFGYCAHQISNFNVDFLYPLKRGIKLEV